MLQKEHDKPNQRPVPGLIDDQAMKLIADKSKTFLQQMVEEVDGITRSMATAILSYLKSGICRGKGVRGRGTMCVQAVVSTVMGHHHSDEPTCVNYDIRTLGVILNDHDCWGDFTEDGNFPADFVVRVARGEALKRFALAQLGTNSTKFNGEEFAKKLSQFGLNKRFLPAAGNPQRSSLGNVIKSITLGSKFQGLDPEGLKEFADDVANILAEMNTPGSKFLDLVD
jgi:hypothetical protein